MATEQTLETIIQNYKNAPDQDYWQVTRNKLRMVRDQMILRLVQNMRFGNVLDFACGLGVIANSIAKQSDKVIGVDGAEPAILQARKLHKDTPNIEFKVADLKNACRILAENKFDLLVVTDAFCYFSHDQQRLLIDYAAENNVMYLLLEIRSVDRNGAKNLIFADGNDFEKPSEIIEFIKHTNYDIVNMGISRVFEDADIANRAAYSKSKLIIARFLKKWIIHGATAIVYRSKRAQSDDFYDAFVLKKRLFLCGVLYRIPFFRSIIEPVVCGIAVLCRRKIASPHY